MLAPAKDAGDAAKRERRAQEAGPQRFPAPIEKLGLSVGVHEADGLQLAPRALEAGGENATDAVGSLRSGRALEKHAHAVAILQFARHVHAILVDVGQLPGQFGPCAAGEKWRAAVVEGIVEVGTDDAAHHQRVDGPRNLLFGRRPFIAVAPEAQDALR